MSGQVKDFKPPVPANFRAELRRTGWTNQLAAQAIGVSEKQVSRWRGGQVPRYRSVERIAKAFGRDTTWFYAYHDDISYESPKETVA